MQNNTPKSRTLMVGAILILAVLLTKRLYLRHFNWESFFSFIGGFVVIAVIFLILKIIMKNK